jgi:hypothetical protein
MRSLKLYNIKIIKITFVIQPHVLLVYIMVFVHRLVIIVASVNVRVNMKVIFVNTVKYLIYYQFL